jgi:hypothetical protein
LFGMNMGSDGLWVVHYLLLGGLTPAISLMVSIIRTLFAIFLFPERRGIVAFASFVVLSALCVVFNNDGWVGYLPVVTAGIYSAVAFFGQNYVVSRALMLLGFICWIVIGAFYGSIIEIVSSGLAIASLLLGAYRHYKSSDGEVGSVH